MYVPAKTSEGQCRDRRCHTLTSLSVSATSWTLLLSPFLSHSIVLPSPVFFLSSASLSFLCYVSTVTLLGSLPQQISVDPPTLNENPVTSLMMCLCASADVTINLHVKTACVVFRWFSKRPPLLNNCPSQPGDSVEFQPVKTSIQSLSALHQSYCVLHKTAKFTYSVSVLRQPKEYEIVIGSRLLNSNCYRNQVNSKHKYRSITSTTNNHIDFVIKEVSSNRKLSS